MTIFLFSFVTEYLVQSFARVGINCGCMVALQSLVPAIMVIALPSLLVLSVTLDLCLPNPFCFPLSPHSLSGSWPHPCLQAQGIRQGEGAEKQCFSCSSSLSGGSCQVSLFSAPLRRAHKHKAALQGRDRWLEKQKTWRTDAAHIISPS